MDKILVTGAAGMLGADLCAGFGARGYSVTGVDLMPEYAGPTAKAPDVYRRCDVTDPEEIRKNIEEEAPRAVIHSAAYTDVDGCEKDPDRAYSVNTEGTRNVASVCGEKNIPLVYISTDFVFNGEKESPYKEEDEPDPLNVYGNSKYDGEIAVHMSGVKGLIIRTSWLFGHGGKNFVDSVIKRSEEGPLRVVNDQVGSPTYTRDLALAVALALESCDPDTNTIVHICNAGQCSWYDLAVTVLDLACSGKREVEPISSDVLDRPARRPLFSVLDTGRFTRMTGKNMRPWKDVLGDYLRDREDTVRYNTGGISGGE